MGRFFDFCLFLRDEFQDSLRAPRTHPIFVEFCPFLRDECSDSSRQKCHFFDFCPFLRDESQDSLRAPRTHMPTRFAIRARAGVVCSEVGAAGVRADIVLTPKAGPLGGQDLHEAKGVVEAKGRRKAEG
jgi:hypothetical protein